MTPNRVNRAHWTTKENHKKTQQFLHVFGPWTNWPEMTPNGARKLFFPVNPNLANILGNTDFDLKVFSLGTFWIPNVQIPGFPGPQIPGPWKQDPGYGWLRLGGGTSRRISAISGRHSRTTEFRRSKDLGKTVRTPSVQALFGES